MFAQVRVDDSQIFGCRQCPAYPHLAANHLFDAGVHLFFLDKESGVRFRKPLPYRDPESLLILKEKLCGLNE